MLRMRHRTSVWMGIGLLAACSFVSAQVPGASAAPSVEQGRVVVEGRFTPYLIRRLPLSSFPELPAQIAALLARRGCQIPQTYEAHRPENVIHASLERPGSSDWAVLCSAGRVVSLLVIFGSSPAEPQVLASVPETDRLQAHDASGMLGFDWGIDPASPHHIHEVQSGLEHRPPMIDHDALADSIVDRRTTYRFFVRNAWTVLDVPE